MIKRESRYKVTCTALFFASLIDVIVTNLIHTREVR